MTTINSVKNNVSSELVAQAEMPSTSKQDYIPNIDAGLNILAQMGDTLPKLPPAGSADSWNSVLNQNLQNANNADEPVIIGVASMGASMAALMVDMASEQKRQNANIRAAQTELITAQIKDQANIMMQKAVVQLCIGVASGALSIAQGVHGAKAATSAKAERSTITDKQELANFDLKTTTNAQTRSSNYAGINSVVSAANSAVGGMFDSQIKGKDATIENLRAMSDTLKNLEESLKELIQKCLATYDSIQQNTNQTRNKIIG